jgi:3-isopropylmalate/(R)-2-methylmalate dehydratase small subunit
MPCVSVDEAGRNKLATMIESDPKLELKIDLVNSEIIAGDTHFAFDIREGARESLMNGKWDPIDELLSNGSSIEKVANSLSYS